MHLKQEKKSELIIAFGCERIAAVSNTCLEEKTFIWEKNAHLTQL